MLRTGLNPYGLTTRSACSRKHNGWLTPLDDAALGGLASRLAATGLEPVPALTGAARPPHNRALAARPRVAG
jgi:hypothetical protein